MTDSDRIMKKVRKGENLSKKEEKNLSNILNRSKSAAKETGKVDKVMTKVAKGKELSDDEQETLNWAIERSKNAKNEGTNDFKNKVRLYLNQYNEDSLEEEMSDTAVKKKAEKIIKRTDFRELDPTLFKNKKIFNYTDISRDAAEEWLNKWNSAVKEFNNVLSDKNLNSVKAEQYLEKAKELKKQLNSWESKVNSFKKKLEKAQQEKIKAEQSGKVKASQEKWAKKEKEKQQRVKDRTEQKRSERIEGAKKKAQDFKGKVKSRLNLEATIDRESVLNAAYDMAVEVYGDDVNNKKVEGMVDKAMSKAKNEQEAIGILKKMFRYK